jgi:6-pyruvoyltetrahydropterin/6-carboxytetrahydropterin synthase
MMYQVSVEQHFDAAHFLREYGGKCENLHGHRFKVVVSVTAEKLDTVGLAYDFTELKKHLAEILSRFDHTCLNEVEPFDTINPSSEHIARDIYEKLRSVLPETIELSSVQVWESPQSCITYSP